MLNSPNKNNFKVFLPKNLLPKQVTDVFDAYLFNEQMFPYNTTLDLFESQIKGYEIPDLGLPEVKQDSGPGERTQLQGLTTHEAFGDKRVEITIRAIDGYLNYHIARYAYMLYAMPSHNPGPATGDGIGDIVIAINTSNSMFRYNIIYKNVIWLGVTGKEFKYDETQLATDDFTLAFAHNGFEIEPYINQTIAKSKGLDIKTNVR